MFASFLLFKFASIRATCVILVGFFINRFENDISTVNAARITKGEPVVEQKEIVVKWEKYAVDIPVIHKPF